jgi:hypothetical protein
MIGGFPHVGVATATKVQTYGIMLPEEETEIDRRA